MSIYNELEISNRFKKYYKFLIVIILLFAAVFLFFTSRKPALAPENVDNYKTEEIKIRGKIIKVEIADTLEKQEKGLSGRQFLPENQGMLFVFEYPDHHSFWMKDMNFSLDFIWIRGKEIVEVNRNVKPKGYELFGSLVPKNKIDKVLEVNAGVAEKIGIQEGDKIEF